MTQEHEEGKFTQIDNEILVDGRASYSARFLYILLKKYAWQKGSCFPGQDRLTSEMGCTAAFLRKNLRELAELGWIEIRKRGQGKTSIYTLLRECQHTATQDYTQPTVLEQSYTTVQESMSTTVLERASTNTKEYPEEEYTEKEDPAKNSYSYSSLEAEKVRILPSLVDELIKRGISYKFATYYVDKLPLSVIEAKIGEVDNLLRQGKIRAGPDRWLSRTFSNIIAEHKGGKPYAPATQATRPAPYRQDPAPVHRFGSDEYYIQQWADQAGLSLAEYCRQNDINLSA